LEPPSLRGMLPLCKLRPCVSICLTNIRRRHPVQQLINDETTELSRRG
jgi:hypothetical protein